MGKFAENEVSTITSLLSQIWYSHEHPDKSIRIPIFPNSFIICKKIKKQWRSKKPKIVGLTLLIRMYFPLYYETPLINTAFNKTIEFMFAGINMLWARLRLILARAVRRGLEWALRRVQNIFVLKNINCITIITTLEGNDKIRTEKKIIKIKKTTKRYEEYFFHERCKNVNK